MPKRQAVSSRVEGCGGRRQGGMPMGMEVEEIVEEVEVRERDGGYIVGVELVILRLE